MRERGHTHLVFIAFSTAAARIIMLHSALAPSRGLLARAFHDGRHHKTSRGGSDVNKSVSLAGLSCETALNFRKQEGFGKQHPKLS